MKRRLRTRLAFSLLDENELWLRGRS